jgi:hypothetical protein
MKVCSKCQFVLSLDKFRVTPKYKDNRFCWCISCESQYRKNYPSSKKEISRKKWRETHPDFRKEYEEKNKETLTLYQKNYYRQNSKKKVEMALDWSRNNRVRSRKIKSEWKKNNRNTINLSIKNRKETSPAFKLRSIISKSIWYYLKIQNSHKNDSCWKYLPYTPQTLKEHLESQFDSWMSWKNYGKYDKIKKRWQIDHIIPQSRLPYNSLADKNFIKCWKLSNLQPLEVNQNIIKSNR